MDLIQEFSCDEVIRQSSLIVFVLTLDLQILGANENAERCLCITSSRIKKSRFSCFLGNDLKKKLSSNENPITVLESLSEGEVTQLDNFTLIALDGTKIRVTGTACRYPAKKGIPSCIFLSLHDISSLQATLDRLALVAKVFDYSGEAIMITDSSDIILTVNDAFSRSTGYPIEEAIGKKPSLFAAGLQGTGSYRKMWIAVHRDGHWKGEVWTRKKTGEVFPEWLEISAVHNDCRGVENYISIFSDLTEQRVESEHLRHQAQHDFLTGLPNRNLLHDRFQQAVNLSKRDRLIPITIFFVDLDGFKLINDTHGHNVGDRILQKITQRFSACIRESDTVSRHGGDEFIFLMLGIEDEKNLALTAAKILAAVSKPFHIQGLSLSIGVSVGSSTYPTDGTTLEKLLKRADEAMYRAKQSGGNAWVKS